MFSAFEILGTLHCLVCVLIAAYGALKRTKRILVFGLCFSQYVSNNWGVIGLCRK